MKNSLFIAILPLLAVAVLGVLTPWVVHHVQTFLGLSGTFWASTLLTLDISLLCTGLAAIRPTMLARISASSAQPAETVLH